MNNFESGALCETHCLVFLAVQSHCINTITPHLLHDIGVIKGWNAITLSVSDLNWKWAWPKLVRFFLQLHMNPTNMSLNTLGGKNSGRSANREHFWNTIAMHSVCKHTRFLLYSAYELKNSNSKAGAIYSALGVVSDITQNTFSSYTLWSKMFFLVSGVVPGRVHLLYHLYVSFTWEGACGAPLISF